ncbi:Oidioi.mRNA.OKI2018_I69.chr1.g2040.t1.cds [Oikopleura dioica]|uniref:Oidioi.mRNA.OKI2018_I69.chr1.g2040.t1.cds n=1 Tax=Oikopleura dioica TaxID=34765 RepID=A0ABN7STB1_OIKDI|nr:Oidioi.mRNA.OKI2018_I69.chr1.g2040.t1.cds [Oikopleura dioica]
MSLNQGDKPLSNRCTRIEVELEKTDQHNYPEFSFLSLKNELEKATEVEGTAADPANKDEDECARIAAMLEAKYSNFGNTASFDKKKRRRHERIEDFMDMGEGYDQDDDFIDDSEAHEIFVPQQYDTWHGGFYVNQGLLRLKMADTAEDEVTLTAGTKQRNFGKPVSESGESDSEKSDDESNSQGDGKDEVDKGKKEDEGPKRGRPPKSQEAKAKPVAEASTKGTPGRPPKNPESKATPGRPPKSPSKTAEPKIAEPPVSLPDADLPENIRTKCNTLRKIAEASKGMSSQKFFSSSVLDLLVEIDNHIKDVSPKIRNATLEYISEPMPCKKDTLMLRLKKMRKDKVESIIKEPFDKFTVMIKKCVDIQTIKYEGQLENFNKRLAEYNEKSKSDPNMKKPRQPSKNFNWTADAKADLFDLVKIKESLYAIQKPKDTTLEAWIKEFVNVEVKSLFPPGWVTYEKLEKVIGIEKNKREMEANGGIQTNGTPKVEKKVGEKRKLMDSPIDQQKLKTANSSQPSKISKPSPEAKPSPVQAATAVVKQLPVPVTQVNQNTTLSTEQQLIAQKVIQIAIEKKRKELEEKAAAEKNKKAQEQHMQNLMKQLQNSQNGGTQNKIAKAPPKSKRSPKELREQLVKIQQQNAKVQKTTVESQKISPSPPKSSPKPIAPSPSPSKLPSMSLPSIHQIASSPTKTSVIKVSPVKVQNTQLFQQPTIANSPQLQAATRRLSNENSNVVVFPHTMQHQVSPVSTGVTQQQQHVSPVLIQQQKSPSSSSFSINNLVSQSKSTSQSFIVPVSQVQNISRQQVQNIPISHKTSTISTNAQEYFVQKQAVPQNIVQQQQQQQHSMTTQNQGLIQARLQQNGHPSAYQYMETTNGVFLGTNPIQNLPTDPLNSIEPTLPIDMPFFNASRQLSGDKVQRTTPQKRIYYYPSNHFY